MRPWTKEEQKVIDTFHRLFYDKGQFQMVVQGEQAKVTIINEAKYLGYQTQKNPLDLWIYQEILFERQPDIVVEMGTAAGGTTLFLAHVMDKIGEGEIISVDIEDRVRTLPEHERITYLVGDTVTFGIWEQVDRAIHKHSHHPNVMVILDDCHARQHVLKELTMYAGYVPPGQYVVVEDTNVAGHPVGAETHDGPWEAVEEFRATFAGKQFVADWTREKFMLTYNPGGYLLRV